MADHQRKVGPFICTSIAASLLFMGVYYMRLDLAFINGDAAYEKEYRTETITYQKSNGETGKLRDLTVEGLGNRERAPSGEKEDSESDAGLVSEELLIAVIYRYLEEGAENNSLRRQRSWLRRRSETRGTEHISGLDASAKESLKRALLDLQKLQQAHESDVTPFQFEDRDEDTWGESPAGMGAIDEDSAELGEFKFREYGELNLRRLVVFSSYRSSLTEFTVVTLSPSVLQSAGGPVYNICAWLPDGSTASPGHFSSLEEMNSTGRLPDQRGSPILRYVEDTHGRPYDTLVIRCSFPEAVGGDRAGGFLYLNISQGLDPSELVPVFHERPRQLEAAMYNATTFRHQYAYCSAPVWTNLSSSHVKQWFMYHHTLTRGDIHYFIYDNIGIDDGTMAVLQPLVEAGSLTLINMHRERNYETWYHTQTLAINDCLNRARFLAKWAIFWDFDEYLHLPAPLTLPALLEQVEEKGAPWVSFGNMWYSRMYCAPESEKREWAVERMLYRLERPVCGIENISHVCEGEMGHRKWIANPREVKVGAIHRALEPPWTGMTLATDVARINHYSGLVAPNSADIDCLIIKDPIEVNDSKVDGWWIKDAELATFAESLKFPAQLYDVFHASVNEG
ncbi:hypothetical protein Mapa_002460 [Marchantia paleacea]|nr:hypothetical protein Mapa_002460 [Marchantia paleacea]